MASDIIARQIPKHLNMSLLSITDTFKNFFDGRKVLVGQTLAHALAVELEYRVPDGRHGAVFIGGLQRKTNVLGHVF
jgi:hypothetical protein